MESKIRVLHIIKSLGRGGAEMLLPETLKLHNQSKFEFHYLYFLPWKDQMVSAIQQNGGKVTCLKASNNIQILFQWQAVNQYIKRNNIQLVHAHLPWAGMVSRLLNWFYGTAVIYSEHNKQERYHFLTRWMNQLTFNWQSHVVAVSRDVKDSIQQNISVHIPVSIIPNGVNTDFFKRDPEAGKNCRAGLGIPESAVVVGIISVFRFQKRLKEWLEIFSTVARKHPALVGIIVGDGPLKQELAQQVELLGLRNKVFLPGLQTEVKPWLSAMDLFMMSSIFEGMPIALLEAMSMECAIVTTDAGGIKEVVRHEQDGLVVSVDRWQDLAEHLETVITDVEKRKRLGIGARQRVEQAFGMQKMVEQLEALYVRTLSSIQ